MTGRTRRALVAALALPIAMALPGCRDSRSEPTRVASGGLRLSAELEPADGRVGANHLWIGLRDGEGRPIEGAPPHVRVHMVAMGAMPAMGGPAVVRELGEGAYRADFELQMGGTWIVEIEAAPPTGETGRFEGSLTVGSPGVRLRAEGGGTPGAGRRPGEFAFDPARIQKVGVRTAAVERGGIGEPLRTVGRVVVDETRLVDVSLKVGGWIEDLRADAAGTSVERGEVLLALYSPELQAAQEELLIAARSSGALGESLLRAARTRLRLEGVAPADIDRILARGRPLEAIPIRSPASGYVIEKHVVAGSAVTAGQRILRIAPLDEVWVEVDLYEEDLPRVHEGQAARVTLSHLPGRSYDATVAYLYPTLSGATRTARARIELDNPELELRPDMFADVLLRPDPHEALLVPEGAVLHAGERDFVFVALGEGRFRPRQVVVGRRAEGRVEILEGLAGGERVVASGTFLIASESRLRAALEQW